MIEMLFDVKETLRCGAELTDRALDRLLPSETQVPASIHKAMRHSVFAGGKRLRPVLCIEAARMVAASAEPPEGVEELAAALEMLHTYSLIHDDLPALDNDDLRRGKPTCHVVFGEATAILAGDALQTQAYETLARLRRPAAAVVEIVRLVAQATGTVEGMIGGQVLDLEAEHHKPTAEMVDAIHRAKTGALIRVSLATGAVYGAAGGVGTPDDVHRLTEFGRKAGLAFQIVDDILDMTQDSAHLGKTAGKDLASDKATWPAVFGIERSLRDANELITSAFEYLEPYGDRADRLKAVAKYLIERKN
jgi:geranylgeranyl diphosphate synthase, type II